MADAEFGEEDHGVPVGDTGAGGGDQVADTGMPGIGAQHVMDAGYPARR